MAKRHQRISSKRNISRVKARNLKSKTNSGQRISELQKLLSGTKSCFARNYFCEIKIARFLHRYLERKCLSVARESGGDGTHSSGSCDLVTVVGESLPRVVPNVILAKREELIPMLMAAIQVRARSN